MRKIKILIVGLILPIVGFSQVVIDYTEIPHQVGTIWCTGSTKQVIINIGTTGGTQIWDFSAQTIETPRCSTFIVDKDSTEYGSFFPDANLVSSNKYYKSFLYQNLTANSLNTLGKSVKIAYNDTMLAEYNPIQCRPLPMAYPKNWLEHYLYSYSPFPQEIEYYDFYSHCKIDAYGAVKIPYGEFNCLRVCSYDTTISSPWDMPVACTSATFSYSFIAENYGCVALISVDSTYGGVDSNLVKGHLTCLTDFIGIEEKSNLQQNARIEIGKNPFISSTTIYYQIPTKANVSLKLYDLSGRVVKTLADGSKPAGSYEVKLSATGLITGIYFVKLIAGNYKITKKLILMR